jgi:hypothetical protein
VELAFEDDALPESPPGFAVGDDESDPDEDDVEDGALPAAAADGAPDGALPRLSVR